MKTATWQIRPAFVLCLAAGLSLAAGSSPEAASGTSEPAARTIATGSKIPISPDAPEQYVVKPGDTLWDISKIFLRDPWYWPEIWYLNPQVRNPHLIYPGDVLKLIYVDGQPRLTVADRGNGTKRLSPQVRAEPLSRAITAIPYEVIAGFAGRPTLLDKDQVNKAPYVVALRDDHIIGAVGTDVYARGLANAAVDTSYSIVHVDGQLRDPDNNDLLGYTGIYVGSGSLATTGDPAKVVLAHSSREALQGDKLFPETVEVGADFVPHAPGEPVKATVIAVKEASVMGQYQIVALNRGSQAGLEPGHVLAIDQRGGSVRDKYSKGGLGAKQFALGRGSKVDLPDEQIGMLMIFNTTPRMSYALVMEASHEVRQGDFARNP